MEEWTVVRDLAREMGVSIHVGDIFDVLVEKHSEDKLLAKYKNRAVFRGNQVWDAHYDSAVFTEMNSCPATMEAAKFGDFYGLLPDHKITTADARQAYTQAAFEGTPTFVRLPKRQWPVEWWNRRLYDPVCRLTRALYGHPCAGGIWEAHCDVKLKQQGFAPVGDEWRSCYFH